MTDGVETTVIQEFKDGKYPDKVPAIAYVDGDLCVLERFKGPSHFPVVINFVFKPMTPETIQKVAKSGVKREAGDKWTWEMQAMNAMEAAQLVALHLKSWDFRNAKGEPVPFTTAEIVQKSVPHAILDYVGGVIMRSMYSVEILAKNSETQSALPS